MTNFDLSENLFSFLKLAQVDTIIVCAGARNAPMVMALDHKQFKIFNFFEERSAAFFAMGLMKAYQKPVAVLTTSGTAVAELLPAAIESCYQELPLILITADRPKSYRGARAPQSIEQVGLFSSYVEACYDLDVYTQDFSFNWSFKKPIHLNVCFDEPLIDKKSDTTANVVLKKTEPQFKAKTSEEKITNPLLIIGELKSEEISTVKQFIKKSKAPIYVESLSQLNADSEVKPYILSSTDTLIKKISKNGYINSIIRIGGIPTLRFWRDLEMEMKSLPVFNFSDLEFTGLSRKSNLQPLSALETIHVDTFSEENFKKIKQIDHDLQLAKMKFVEKFSECEPSFVYQLSKIVNESSIYLGNSLPIRHWDQFSCHQSKSIYANRGANGIDGQISTYLGWSQAFDTSFCLIGDLTALYDLASLGLTDQLKNQTRRIVVMNNFGGQIFQRVFNNDIFINKHKTQFKSWAEMWGWDYLLITQSNQFQQINQQSSKKLIVEIQPDMQQTNQFWIEWDQACQKV